MKKEIMCSPTTPRPTRTTIVLLLLLYLLCAHTSLARRRSPAAAFVGYTRLYTAAVPGSINTVPYLVAVRINTTFYSPLYVRMIYRYR